MSMCIDDTDLTEEERAAGCVATPTAGGGLPPLAADARTRLLQSLEEARLKVAQLCAYHGDNVGLPVDRALAGLADAAQLVVDRMVMYAIEMQMQRAGRDEQIIQLRRQLIQLRRQVAALEAEIDR